MKLNRVTTEDFGSVIAFYDDVTDRTHDALASNIPAHKIYKSLGFEFRGQQHLYAENTGWTDFYFFELKQ